MHIKTKAIYELMHKLANGEELTVNKELADSLDIENTKTLSRYLQELKNDYPDIITVEKKKIENHPRKPNVYRAIDQKQDLSTVLKFFFENRTDLGWVLQLLHEKDSTLAVDGEYQEEINKLISQESDIFIFKSTPFEILDNVHKKIFSKLKIGIKYGEYKTIIYNYNHKKELLQDVKCLKLIFTQDNWYVAIEDEKESFRLLRVSFIENLRSSSKGNYQKSRMRKYEQHYQNIQNAMTLHNQPLKKAICRAAENVAIYFQKEMKPFLISQRYLKTNDDGTIDFELSYTQPIEILPFIKRWLPDIKIIEPSSLVELLKNDLDRAMKDYSA